MTRHLYLLFVGALVALSVGATDSISLTEQTWRWKFVADAERGATGTANGWEAPDLDDSDWEQVAVGEAFQQQGVVWYRTRVSLPATWRGQAVILRLGTPDDGAEVYVNGVAIGHTVAKERGLSLPLPTEGLQYGDDTQVVIAVRLWNWHQRGGLHTPPLSLECLQPFAQPAAAAPIWSQRLRATDDLADGVLKEGQWEYGYRDEGTSDTRPNLKLVSDTYNGQDAVLMDVWYPNSREMVDYILQPGETGSDLANGGAAYLTFRYKTDSLRGDMTVRLNHGRLRWGSRVSSYVAMFPVQPGADWQVVTLPLAAFAHYDNRGEVDHTLSDLGPVQVLSIGYDNHRLQGPGTVQFTDFRFGAVPTVQPAQQPVSLAGLWRFRLDNQRPDGSPSDFGKGGDDKDHEAERNGFGRELGWMDVDYDDSAWSAIPVPASWETHGYDYNGPAWYRCQVLVPAHWQGQELRLRLGRPDDRGSAWWNGVEIQTIPKFGKHFEVVLKPEQIQYGAVNTIAVQIHDWYRSGGLNSGQFEIGPATTEPRAAVTLEWQGEPASASVATAFEMGAKPPTRNVLVRATFQSDVPLQAGMQVAYEFVDCFHRPLAAGRQPVEALDGALTAAVMLDAGQTRQLYYAEWFDVRFNLLAADGRLLDSYCERDLKLKYAERDALALPALPETLEDTPYGKLPLVDVIDCAAADTATPHPYKEGGIRASWVGTRAYATWEQGVTIGKLGDTAFREVNNNEHFGYRIGRGQMKPHTAYLLRVRVPDDKARYMVMDIQTGRNYQGNGYRASTGPDDPLANYPHTGEMQWYDLLVFSDDTTYGYEGSRKANGENGFWVFFHDNGRIYTGQYDAGAAVAEMRLYEIPDIAAHYPTIRYPEGAPHRTLMMDWERQPEAPPADVARYAKFMGLNVIAPVFQKWSSHGFWHSEAGFQPPGWYRVLGEEEDDRDTYEMWLDATREHQIGLMPRIEYGGGPNLIKEARAIGTNGKIDPAGRFCRWGANILHEATWTELEMVVQEMIGQKIADNPQLVGLLWRQRQDRIRVSYGAADVALFCKETGATMQPGMSDEAAAKWASTEVADDYHAWWQGKRADYLRSLRDLLKTYRGDLVLGYYNWDQDGWKLGHNKNQQNSAQDWSDLYNVERAPAYWQRVMKTLAETEPGEFLTMLQTLPEQHERIFPAMFSAEAERDYQTRKRAGGGAFDPMDEVELLAAETKAATGDILIFAPVNFRYLADNDAYINYFQTADGLAVCNMFDYEEKGRWNIQGDRYETSELTPGGHDYGMAEEVLACFHGDPNVITWTTYTYGRGWIDGHRRFAQAFLALPDMRGEVLAAAAAPASDDLRVRLYRTDARSYVGVVHRGSTTLTTTLTIPVAGGTVTDLVTGEPVPAEVVDGKLVFRVTVGPMSLNSYGIAP